MGRYYPGITHDNRLTDQAYWDQVYSAGPSAAAGARGSFRQWLRYIGRKYSQQHFWSVLERHLPRGPLSVLEIGSAPGLALKELRQRFGYEPYGVEYAKVGVEVNRANFMAWGLDPKHIFESDVFAEEFQSEHPEQFDVVMSRGFIEHFTDLRPVIEAHANLLKPGGSLVVSIPNYSGVNYALGWLTSRSLYPLHNLAIMHLPTFRSLFEIPGMVPLFCDYEGGFDFGIFDSGVGSALLINLERRLQWALDVIFNVVRHVPETRWTSPQLLYIGRKNSTAIP